MWHVSDRSQPSSANDEHNNVKSHPILPHQKTSKLRFVSSVEFRHSSGETLTTQLSPSSPTEDSSGESRSNRPRLQRSTGQSKKTFRLRKSRRSRIEVSHIKLESPDTSNQPMASTPPTATELSVSGIPSESSSIRSKRSLSARQGHNDSRGNHQQSDISWDEDTSVVSQTLSTSGYRESYSMQLISLESGIQSAPPLASPDLNDLPSTSSATTNYIVCDGSSPDCSINGSGGEKTALLTNSQRSLSQHSLLMS
ncbi:uncharacterized protein LOC124409181 [Diprion similis]|uniref:uncharacterized protein LOC124409181 n=1 Tax=Diprion similis TaxID=362088 RepID=UPI001EF7CB24|nr:uncharacterized protein LOC124409181 [Diprion similis]